MLRITGQRILGVLYQLHTSFRAKGEQRCRIRYSIYCCDVVLDADDVLYLERGRLFCDLPWVSYSSCLGRCTTQMDAVIGLGDAAVVAFIVIICSPSFHTFLHCTVSSSSLIPLRRVKYRSLLSAWYYCVLQVEKDETRRRRRLPGNETNKK